MKFFISLLILVAACSCGRDGSVNRCLDRAEEVMNDHPDSALRLIRTIRPKDISRERTYARYAMRYSQALDKNLLDLKLDTLARRAVDYYMEHGSDHEKTVTLFYMGRIYMNAMDNEQAFRTFTQADVCSREIGNEDPYLRGLVLHWLGHCYFKQNGMAEALKCYERAEKYYAEAGVVKNVASTLRDQSICHNTLHNEVAAKECIRKSLDYYRKIQWTEEDLAPFDEYFAVLEVVCDTTKTDAQRVALLHSQLTEQPCVPTMSYGKLSELYEKMGKIDSARYYMELVVKHPIIDDNLLIAYESLSRLEKRAGASDKAHEYFEKYARLKDSLQAARYLSVVEMMNQRIEAAEMQYDYNLLQVRHRYHTIIGVLGLLLALGLGWQLVRVTRIWRRRMVAQKLAYEQLRTDLSGRLTAAHDELNAKVRQKELMDDEREQRFYETLENRLAGLRNMVINFYTYKVKPQTLVEDFETFATVSPCKRTESWADLQYVVNKKYKGVVELLRQTYPSLAPQDIDLCCLICFEFTPESIAFIYGCEDLGSLYNRRSRVRQKLGLPERAKLEKFLLDLCMQAKGESPDAKVKAPRKRKALKAV